MGINFADDAMDRTNMMNIEWNVAKQEYMKTFFAMAIDRENCKNMYLLRSLRGYMMIGMLNKMSKQAFS